MFLFSPTDYHHEAPYPIVAADDESSMSAYWFCIPQIRSIKLKGDRFHHLLQLAGYRYLLAGMGKGHS